MRGTTRRLVTVYAIIAVVLFIIIGQLVQNSVPHTTRALKSDFYTGYVDAAILESPLRRNIFADGSLGINAKHVNIELVENESSPHEDTRVDKVVENELPTGFKPSGNDYLMPQMNGESLHNENDYQTKDVSKGRTIHNTTDRHDGIGGTYDKTDIFNSKNDVDKTSIEESFEYRKNISNTYFRHNRNQILVNCSAIIKENNAKELAKAKQIMTKKMPNRLHIEKHLKTLNCNQFKQSRGYIMHPLSDMEREFPLAFSIIVYRDFEQVERLLRAIYRPHNYYCVHIDVKADPIERQAFELITSCLDNVVIASMSYNVTWGTFSVLEAELVCMQTLWQYKKWKYFINLTGQEFPLKTNRELVAILKSFDGANIVDGTWIRYGWKLDNVWREIG